LSGGKRAGSRARRKRARPSGRGGQGGRRDSPGEEKGSLETDILNRERERRSEAKKANIKRKEKRPKRAR